MRKLYILCVIALAALIIGLAWADQITLTTYYPAPYGVYNDMVVMNSLGIGTTSPDDALHVYRDYNSAGSRTTDSSTVFIDGATGKDAWLGWGIAGVASYVAGFDDGNKRLDFWGHDETTWRHAMTMTTAGNVGIGRMPATNKLEVEGDASKTAAGDWLANSDIKIKTDLRDIKNALDIINKLHPIKFRYTDEYRAKHPSIKGHYYYNFIAQEFQEIFPDSVKNDGEGYLQIDTYNVRPYLVAAVQELNEVVNVLKVENEVLIQRIEVLELQFKVGQDR